MLWSTGNYFFYKKIASYYSTSSSDGFWLRCRSNKLHVTPRICPHMITATSSSAPASRVSARSYYTTTHGARVAHELFVQAESCSWGGVSALCCMCRCYHKTLGMETEVSARSCCCCCCGAGARVRPSCARHPPSKSSSDSFLLYQHRNAAKPEHWCAKETRWHGNLNNAVV